jgi:hypothetical protein
MPLCRREEGMARRPALDDRALQFDYRFDCLLPQKLEQVYEVLVPPVRRPIGSVEFDSLQEKVNEQTSCNLCAGFLRPSEGGPHYRQSDYSPGGICADQAEERELKKKGSKIRLVAPVYFCASKLEAFASRGANDFHAPSGP